MSTTLITNHQAAIPGKKKDNWKGTRSAIVLIYSPHLCLRVESYENAAQVWSWRVTRSALVSRRHGSHLIPLNIQFVENDTRCSVKASSDFIVKKANVGTVLHRTLSSENLHELDINSLYIMQIIPEAEGN